jgi:NADPH:quinone reductase
MKTMRAIEISSYGGPEVLRLAERLLPAATPGTVVVRVQAFGLNHAEAYFRSGVWGEVPKVTGIECVGEVHDPGQSTLRRGQRVFALLGGMGRTIDGSYAEYVRAPEGSVVPIDSAASWEELAAIPESYATAWTFLQHNLEVRPGQTILVRGGTSALGQALVTLARAEGVRVLGTTRSPERAALLERRGAEVLLDRPDLSSEVRGRFPDGLDGVVDVVGVSTLPDSLRMVRYRGRVALAGFLGGGGPLTVDPLVQLPSGVHLSFTGSAFLFGTAALPLGQIPFQELVSRAGRGELDCRPAHVFAFEQIVEAHRLMESGRAQGKIVVRAP